MVENNTTLVTSRGLQSYKAARLTLLTAKGVAKEMIKIPAIKGSTSNARATAIPTVGRRKSFTKVVKKVSLKF